MFLFLSISIAGGLGATLRYLISGLINKNNSPWGTFFVNILGCFIFGIFASLFNFNCLCAANKTILLSGFCGGFTTFSTFISEGANLLTDNKLDIIKAFIYILSSLIFGLLFMIIGLKISMLFS